MTLNSVIFSIFYFHRERNPKIFGTGNTIKFSCSENFQLEAKFFAASMITRSSSFSRLPLSISRVLLASIPQNQELENMEPGTTEQQQKKVEAIVALGSQMLTTAMACVDVLFSERELANSNTAGTFGFEKLNEEKM